MNVYGFLTKGLRVTIYCSSYEFHFIFGLRVITYCTSYDLIFAYELRVFIYYTSYKLNLSLRVASYSLLARVGVVMLIV